MALEPVEILNSSLSLICVVFFTIVGILMILKYHKYKDQTLLLVGIAWIIMGTPWWPSSFGFLFYISSGVGISLEAYLMLGNTLLPVGVLCFVEALTNLKYQEKKKLLFWIFMVIGIVYEIYFISFLIINPTELGVLISLVDIDFGLVMTLYLIFALVITVSIGIIIAIESFKSENKEIRLKGKFLLAAFISLLVGASMDTLLQITFITVPIIRIILITSAIEIYFGFFLPSWLKNRFIK